MSLNFSKYKSLYKKICVFYFAIFYFSFSFLFLDLSFAHAEKLEDLNFKNVNYVIDYANIIDDNIESDLNTKLYNYFASTTNQIIVLTVNSMSGDYIEHYSIKLAEKIKAGSAKNDNGVILLITKDEKQMRIEVGYGLEPVLTDGKSSYIINSIIKPEFKNNNYSLGIKNGVEEIINILENKEDGNYVNYSTNINGENSEDYNSQDSKVSNFFKNNNSNIFKFLSHVPVEIYFILFFFGISIFQWLVSILGRTKSWWLGGVLGFILAAIIFFFLIKTFFVFLLGLIGFAFDYIISKNYKEHVAGTKSGPPDWWAGGGSFGGGGYGGGSGWSSSSGGGFSGGGGSFGGGGSSGSW